MTEREGPITQWSDAYLARKLRATQAQIKGGWCHPILLAKLRELRPQMRREMRRRDLKLSDYPAYELCFGQPFYVKTERPEPEPVAQSGGAAVDSLEALLAASLEGGTCR